MAEKNLPTNFLKYRDQWIRMVINDPDIEHTAARVAVHIAMRMRTDQQFCWPSIDTISKETGVSRRAVSTALDCLTGGVGKNGVINSKMLYRESRPNVGNMYSLVFPWI